MSYPHQPGSPLFDGADAYEAYCKEQWFVCDACDGSGVEVFGVRVYEHGCGFAHDSSDERPCERCGGVGGWVGEAIADGQQ